MFESLMGIEFLSLLLLVGVWGGNWICCESPQICTRASGIGWDRDDEYFGGLAKSVVVKAKKLVISLEMKKKPWA